MKTEFGKERSMIESKEGRAAGGRSLTTDKIEGKSDHPWRETFSVRT
jgi:hypothetical protein